MLKLIAIAVGIVIVAVGAVLIYAATRPDAFRVQRTATMKASPEKIVAQLEDFSRWTAWSPWETKDPAMARTLGGAAKGKGATYAWAGNGQVGAGRMEILDATPGRVAIQLDFTQPFEGHNIAEFTLRPTADGATTVTWTMSATTRPFIAKLVGVFLDMDKMIGADFETGLANLKRLTEA